MYVFHMHMYKKMNNEIGITVLLKTTVLALFPQTFHLKKSGVNILGLTVDVSGVPPDIRIGFAVLSSLLLLVLHCPCLLAVRRPPE